MTPGERVSVLERGVEALRDIERELRQRLPPPERDDVVLLLELRDVAGLADRVELALEIEGDDLDAIYSRDSLLSMGRRSDDSALLAGWADHCSVAESPYRDTEAAPDWRVEALTALAALLCRYDAGEFYPPDAWFGLRAGDA